MDDFISRSLTISCWSNCCFSVSYCAFSWSSSFRLLFSLFSMMIPFHSFFDIFTNLSLMRASLTPTLLGVMPMMAPISS